MTLSSAELRFLEETKRKACMRTQEECAAFETNVCKLAQNKSPEMLQALLGLFDDDCPALDVMYTLVQAVETYPADVYVNTLIASSTTEFSGAAQWLMILLYGLLNNPAYRDAFTSRLRSLFGDTGVGEFFQRLRLRTPERLDEINELEQKCV